VSKKYKFESDDDCKNIKEICTCFKICFRKDSQILGLNIKKNKKRFKIVLQRYYNINKEDVNYEDFQIFKEHFDDIIRNLNLFYFIIDTEYLDIIIQGLTREMFHIKPSIKVDKFINDLFDWVMMDDEL